MAIKKIDKIYCSLNLGYIYNLNYNYSPSQGKTLTLFFINETGEYDTSNIISSSRKVQVKIGNTALNLYAKSYSLSKNESEKVLKVDFIDETFMLDNYYIALTGKGCGKNVFQLGKQVDKRTDAEKEQEDPDLWQIKKLTTFEDIEYSFSDFISALRSVFPVYLRASSEDKVTRDFTGTFRQVLDSWCSYFNYSYFFEDSQLVIYDPSSLLIDFPQVPEDAISSEFSEDISNTFDKTCWVNFQSDGGEIQAGIANKTLIQGLNFRPWEDISFISANNDIFDNAQVAAALYGQEIWFLYNLYKGTEQDECGFFKYGNAKHYFDSNLITIKEKENVDNNLQKDEQEPVYFIEDIFNKNFNKYYTYGKQIAGRYYIGDKLSYFSYLRNFAWSIDGKDIQLNEFVAQENNSLLGSFSPIPETVSDSYTGVFLDGKRFFYVDTDERDYSVFDLTSLEKNQATTLYNKILDGLLSSKELIWRQKYMIYLVKTSQIDFSRLGRIFSLIENSGSEQRKILDYKEKTLYVTGIYETQISNVDNDINDIFNNKNITLTTLGPKVSSNTSTVKAIKDSNYVIYFSKYIDCFSESTNSSNFSRKFESISPSIDNPIKVDYKVDSMGVINIKRDFSYVDKYKNSGLLRELAKPFSIKEKKLTFTLNYFYNNIPSSFLSNGLVSMSINISDSGLTASYSYSNEMLRVPTSNSFIDKLEKSIKNSYIREYRPIQTI